MKTVAGLLYYGQAITLAQATHIWAEVQRGRNQDIKVAQRWGEKVVPMHQVQAEMYLVEAVERVLGRGPIENYEPVVREIMETIK